jgi:hypothetical protein
MVYDFFSVISAIAKFIVPRTRNIRRVKVAYHKQQNGSQRQSEQEARPRREIKTSSFIEIKPPGE